MPQKITSELLKLAALIRYFILTSTTNAGSGHATSSLSATDLMTVLMFGGFFKADLKNPANPNNDRLIFSKGHASPLFYSLYAAAGAIEARELDTLRKFGSRLEGHPTLMFPYTEVPTGSLGQGLSVGLGMALNATYRSCFLE
jgi:transketolase